MNKLFDSKIKKLILIFSLCLSILMNMLLLFTPIEGQDISIVNNASFIVDQANFKPLICMFIHIFFYVNLAFSLAGTIFILKEKDKHSIYLIPNIIINITTLILSNVFQVLSGFGITCIIFSLIFSLLNVVYVFLERRLTNTLPSENQSNKRPVYLLTLLSLGITFASLFIPFAIVNVNGIDISIIPITALFTSEIYLENAISLIYIFIWMVTGFIVLFSLFNHYQSESKFYKKARNLININYVFSIIYLIAGIIYSFANNILGFKCNTASYIPCILLSIIAIVFSIYYGKLIEKEEKQKNKKTSSRRLKYCIEIDIYALLFTIITVLTILLDILVVNYDVYEFSGNIKINGIDIITHYATLEPKLQLIALLMITQLTVSAIMFIATIISSFSKSRSYYRIAIFSIVLNITFTFMIGLFGQYFEIAQHIDFTIIKTIIENNNYDIDLDANAEYSISSQSFYLFLIDVILLFIVLCRAPITKLEKNTANNDLVFEGANSPSAINNNVEFNDTRIEAIDERDNSIAEEELEKIEENKNIIADFDACPSFTEIDQKIEYFKEDLNHRKTLSYENPTLPTLVRFIVNYARESRLHLFYSFEDIATFIAGLGSSRLSILQGMSGTGKTSLPKIFSEAIIGNCEIIEVESSWRDKNELLGYFNEFSKNYTPKKFTQALYKARLNEEVMTFIVLDEMNLSRIEYYFSDFLSLMENEEDKREIKLLNVKIFNDYDNEHHSYLGLKDDHTIKVPKNIFFIGTANKDESTFEISDKVYDRAMTMNFNSRAKVNHVYNEEMNPRYLSYEQFNNLIKNAKDTYVFDIDDNKIIKEVERILQPYNISFGYRIARQIESFVKIYCSCFDNPHSMENDALEIILLSKVVAKLENKNIENKELLITEFDRLNLYRCSKFIAKLNED